MQAMVRGWRTRKYVRQIYGFEASPGLRHGGLVHVEMDPERLEE
jgi:hypothetical protein